MRAFKLTWHKRGKCLKPLQVILDVASRTCGRWWQRTAHRGKKDQTLAQLYAVWISRSKERTKLCIFNNTTDHFPKITITRPISHLPGTHRFECTLVFSPSRWTFRHIYCRRSFIQSFKKISTRRSKHQTWHKFKRPDIPLKSSPWTAVLLRWPDPWHIILRYTFVTRPKMNQKRQGKTKNHLPAALPRFPGFTVSDSFILFVVVFIIS